MTFSRLKFDNSLSLKQSTLSAAKASLIRRLHLQKFLVLSFLFLRIYISLSHEIPRHDVPRNDAVVVMKPRPLASTEVEKPLAMYIK